MKNLEELVLIFEEREINSMEFKHAVKEPKLRSKIVTIGWVYSQVTEELKDAIKEDKCEIEEKINLIKSEYIENQRALVSVNMDLLEENKKLKEMIVKNDK